MKKLSFFFLDIALAVFSLGFAALLKFDFKILPENYNFIIYCIPIAIITTIIFSLVFDSYKSFLTYFGFSELFKQFSVSVCVGIIFFIIKLTGKLDISGAITIMYCGIYFILSSIIRGIPRLNIYLTSAKSAFVGKNKRVIIIGAGNAGTIIAKQLTTNSREKRFPVAILDDDTKKYKGKIAGVKIKGSIDKVSYYAKELKADEILIAIPSAKDEDLNRILNLVADTNLPTKIFQSEIDIDEYAKGNTKVLRDVTIEDLLFRDPIKTDIEVNRNFIKNKVVIVTGGAGSIGSELCRQVLQNKCKFLVIFDINENGLFEINEELKGLYPDRYVTCLGSIRDASRVKDVFDTYSPDLVFHAAAHKHVPMMEINPFEAVKNNVFGTLNVIKQAVESKCQKFILISTDKAVNPTNVMGATKRCCELLVKAYSNQQTEMVAVRFGNVLGSNGSVIPLFKNQIAHGGPVTLTHRDMTRFFMTIPEAVSLVLSAGASAKGSELFVLDMGQPIKIYDLALNLIRLSGFKPFEDIDIIETGLRPGEKMYEELNLDDEIVDKSTYEKFFVMRDRGLDKKMICNNINKLLPLVEEQNDEKLLRKVLFNTIKEETLVSK